MFRVWAMVGTLETSVMSGDDLCIVRDFCMMARLIAVESKMTTMTTMI